MCSQLQPDRDRVVSSFSSGGGTRQDGGRSDGSIQSRQSCQQGEGNGIHQHNRSTRVPYMAKIVQSTVLS